MKRTGWILCICAFLVFLLPVHAAAYTEQTQSIVRDLISYYFHYGDQAAGEIENQLQTMESLDPEEGRLWREVMDDWVWVTTQMPVYTDVLPDGLPEDDSLCIVVLGFGLMNDGSMKPELVNRLETALRSAEKYPEAHVLCTGGETAAWAPGISEAGQMGNWLLKKGLAHNRLILETEALSTTANAKNSLALLWREYPQVKSLAIVSSDYHIRWGSTIFSAAEACGAVRQGNPRLEIVGNAGCATETPDRDSMYSQAWGISIIAEVEFDAEYVADLYMPEVQEVTEPAAEVKVLPAEVPIQAEPATEEPVVPVLLGLAAVLLILFFPKRNKPGGSN